MTTSLSPESASQSLDIPYRLGRSLVRDAGVLGLLRGTRPTHGGHAGVWMWGGTPFTPPMSLPPRLSCSATIPGSGISPSLSSDDLP